MTEDNSANIEKATLYEKYRLPYAPELVADLLGRLDAVQVVADIGAGTGQLARMFANRSSKVYAVEPDPGMRQVASAALAGLASIEIVAGSAEHTTLADSSVDLIVIGSAFHRFKPEACDELRRILNADGWIALINYTFTNKAYTEMLFPRLAALPGLAGRIDKAWHRMPMQALFGLGQVHTLSYPQAHKEDWTGFFGAASSGIEAPERTDPHFAQFEAVNREVFEALAVDGKIQIDYETRVSFGQPLVQ